MTPEGCLVVYPDSTRGYHNRTQDTSQGFCVMEYKEGMNKKTWIKVKRGLLEPKHREKLGVRIWLYLYMLDQTNWDTGQIERWKDSDHAEALGMPWRTLQDQRQQLQADGYISCEKGFQDQTITIMNWTSPREYSGEVYNPQESTEPARTRKRESTRSSVPIPTESSVPLLIDHIFNTYNVDVPGRLRTMEFVVAWREWEEHRKEIKKRLTKTSVKRQFRLLEKYDSKTAVEIIGHSITSGWQGLFEPKKGGYAKAEPETPQYVEVH